ncbi:MAG: tetratricopeptide repeat protein [Planctomycetota bacterium]|nr:tetratricopeptide repeat protein [Planctomycetota bacterium]
MNRCPAHPVWIWVADLLLPGAGHVWVGFVKGGAAMAVAWGFLTGGALVLEIFRAGAAVSSWEWALRGSAAGVYVAAQASLGFRLRAIRRVGQTDRDGRFCSALVAYLQDRLDESESVCRALLESDPDDVEAFFQLAMIARRRGDAATARRHLVRARYLDDAGRWDFEIEREMSALAGSAGRAAK